MPEIFVSYATADQAMANRLVQALELRNLTCWIASREVPLGRNYQREIPSAIAACPVFLLLHSRAAAQSFEVEKEMSIAQRARKPFIPLRLDDSTPEGAFLYELSTRQYLDMFPDFEASVLKLSLQLANLGAHPAEVERRARNLARLRAVRMWSFRTALVAVACLGAALVWKAAPVLHAMTHRDVAAIAEPSPPQELPQPPPPPTPDPPRESAAAERARAVALRYYAMAGGSPASWLQFLNANVADPVRYFGRPLSKARLLDMERAYVLRWPGRRFEVRPTSPDVTCDTAGSCTVSGNDVYALRSEARHAGVTGAERFSLQVASGPGRAALVTAITSAPVDPRAVALSDGPAR